MPSADRAKNKGWILYGKNLDMDRVADFQRHADVASVIVNTCCVEDYQVVHLTGHLSTSMKIRADEYGLDVIQLDSIPCLQLPGLLAMDMDSTAIQIECIDEIARLAGIGDEIAEITSRAMRGELAFAASLRQRVAALKGVDISLLQQVRDKLPLTPGLVSLVTRLQSSGWHIAIISGGFTYYADYLRDKLGLSAAVANQLEIHDNRLTGKLTGPIIDAQYKACTLVNLAQKWNIPLEQTVAVGDGANDVNMLSRAGLGIAFHAKPVVRAKASAAICHGDLMSVFCILYGGQPEVR